jgi:hypothetical protein
MQELKAEEEASALAAVAAALERENLERAKLEADQDVSPAHIGPVAEGTGHMEPGHVAMEIAGTLKSGG